MSSYKCKTLFESLPNVETVNCSVVDVDLAYGGITLKVIFRKFPTLPYENNIYYHEGNPLISSFYCDKSLQNGTATGVACNITDSNTNYTLPGYFTCIPYILSFYTLFS